MSTGSYITPFLNTVSILGSSCLLRDGFNLAMQNAPNFLRVPPSSEAASKILLNKECSLLSARCLAHSDLFSVELYSDQRYLTLQMVSPM